MNDIAKDEKREIEHDLHQTSIHQKYFNWSVGAFITLSPGKVVGLVARFVNAERDDKEQGNRYPRTAFQFALSIGKQVIDDKQLTSDNTGNLFAMSADPQYLCDVVDGLYELTKLNPDMEKIPSLGFHEMLEELEYILKISGKNKEFIEFMQVYREAMALYNTAIKEKQTDLVTVLKNVANQRSR